MNLSPPERALVERTQAKLAEAKAALRIVAADMREMSRINREAGRLKAANAAMRLEGAAAAALGSIVMAHADASDALVAAFDDGGVVVQGGGGGR